jgi:hypothetical protein
VDEWDLMVPNALETGLIVQNPNREQVETT